jgi:AraC-like DNA-binding protein
MRGTARAAEFEAAPIGRYLLGSSWLHFCSGPELFGVILWGRPDRQGTNALASSLAIELGEDVAPHQSLVDVSRVDSVDGEAFEVLSSYVRDHAPALARQVTRLALVRPPGLPGAVASGFFEVIGSPYPVVVVDDLPAAVAALGLAPELATTIDSLANDAVGVPAPLGALRTAILERLGQSIELGAISKDLGMSERSLQRRLQELGTTFQGEVTAVRIAAAQRRMLDTDAPLTAIALDLGFTSLQHFSNQFRKIVGQAPSSWREMHR